MAFSPIFIDREVAEDDTFANLPPALPKPVKLIGTPAGNDFECVFAVAPVCVVVNVMCVALLILFTILSKSFTRIISPILNCVANDVALPVTVLLLEAIVTVPVNALVLEVVVGIKVR